MLFVYPAIVKKKKDSFWIHFPDIPNCQPHGDSLSEVIESAQEILSAYLLTTIAEKKEIVPPSDIYTLSTPRNCFSTLISCEINQEKATKSVKKTLTIPAWLNDQAIAKEINFSKTLQDALIKKISEK